MHTRSIYDKLMSWNVEHAELEAGATYAHKRQEHANQVPKCNAMELGPGACKRDPVQQPVE